jgi:hypothetical protein
VDASDISICSNTLRSLLFCIWNSPPIEVIAPTLEKLCISFTVKARFSIPKVSELVWTGNYANDSHQFGNVSRRLQLLEITWDERYRLAPLLQKFDEVDEMKLIIYIPGVRSYQQNILTANRIPYDPVIYLILFLLMSHDRE